MAVPLGSTAAGATDGDLESPPAGAWGNQITAVANHEGELYWVTASGAVTAPEGRFRGDMTSHTLNGPIVGMTITPSGDGYWLLGSDGGIFSFGDAEFHGSTGDRVLNQPINAMGAHPDGAGYWLAASDGGVFTFGDADFHGSTGHVVLNDPMVGMTPTASGQGYWMVAADGGVFTFGDAVMYGSLGDDPPEEGVVTMQASPTGEGYWLVDAAGRIHPFGDAPALGTGVGVFDGAVIGAVPVVVDGIATGMRMVDENGEVATITPNGADKETSPAPAPAPAPAPDGRTPSDPAGTTPVWDGTAPANTGTTEWLAKSTNDDGSPYRWDGCRAIPYWTDLAGGPSFAASALDQAVAEIERVSGYDLVWQGNIEYHPSQWNSFKASRRGLIVAFSDASEEINLSGYTVGWGGFTRAISWYDDGGNRSWITAGFALADREVSWQNGWGTWSSLQVLFLHELGHALNLGHVSSPAEIMYPSLQTLTQLGPGDAWGISTMADVMPCDPDASGSDTAPYGSQAAVIAPDEPMTFTAAIRTQGPDVMATYGIDGDEPLESWLDRTHEHHALGARPAPASESAANSWATPMTLALMLMVAGGVVTVPVALARRRD